MLDPSTLEQNGVRRNVLNNLRVDV
jgi:hypothetical protein